MKIWSGYGKEPPDYLYTDIEEEDGGVEDEKFIDDDREKSDREEAYVPSTETDPTKNWVGFHDAIVNQDIVDSNSEDSMGLSSGSSEDETSQAVGILKKKVRYVYNDRIDMSNLVFEVGMMFPDAKSLKKSH